MAEEFQESEVMFQENFEIDENEGNEFPCDLISRESRNRKAKRKKLKSKKNSSSPLPVNIPDGNHCFQYVDTDFVDEEYSDDDGELVPPHVIIGRRIAGKMMAFSVCTGNGRTLKGRDLRQVRNSILRKTGFLET